MKKRRKIKKILFLVEQTEYSRYYYNLFLNLQKKANFEISIININHSDEFIHSLDQIGLESKNLNLVNGYLKNSFFIFREIKKVNPDIIHAHEIIPSFYASIYSKLFKVKCIYHRHHGKSRNFIDWVYSLVATIFSDKVIVVSQKMKELARTEFPFSNKKYSVIHNGITSIRNLTVKFNTDINRNFQFKFGMLARFRKEKNHLLAINLIHKLRIEYQIDCALFLAGSGMEEHTIKHQIKILGLESEIFFLGKVQDIKGFFDFVDIHLIPSLSEPFGLVAIEAMENRTVNIASNVGGLTEIIDHSSTGFLFESNNIQDFLEKTLFVIQNHEVKMQVEENAFNKYKSSYTPEVMADNYLRLYQDLENGS